MANGACPRRRAQLPSAPPPHSIAAQATHATAHKSCKWATCSEHECFTLAPRWRSKGHTHARGTRVCSSNTLQLHGDALEFRRAVGHRLVAVALKRPIRAVCVHRLCRLALILATNQRFVCLRLHSAAQSPAARVISPMASPRQPRRNVSIDQIGANHRL